MLAKMALESENLVSKNTHAVFDPAFTRALKAVPWSEWLDKSPPFQCREEYLQKIHSWIHSTRLNRIEGLERFSQKDLIIGTTQGFDEFYFRHAAKRLRFFRGEYAYHRRVSKNWQFLEDADLGVDDVVIISWPFCSTGDQHASMMSILDQALLLQVPVLIDCAYFGTCHLLHFNFDHPAITEVCFSLSKSLGLGNMRSGVRYSNYTDDFPIRQQNRFNHTVLADAKIGIYMMEQFSPDHIAQKYSTAQSEACKDAGLMPTPCMHLATANVPGWDQYRIDDKYIRIGIRELVKARQKKRI